jgi:uncharacterized protein (TIGR03067 family)
VWKPVSLEMNATALPPASFAQQQLTLQDTSYTFVAESTDKGAAYYKDGKMDLYGRDGVNAGKHFMCIYKWEGEQLRICYNLAGNGYPGEFSTKGKPTYFMAVFQRIPKP